MKPACDGAELCVYTDGLNGTERFYSTASSEALWCGPERRHGRKETKCNKQRSVYLGCWQKKQWQSELN